MKHTNLSNNSGMASIIEVIVAAVIFMLAAFGIFTSISSLRPEGTESADKLEAAYKGRELLDELRSNLDPTSWNDGRLTIGTHTTTSADGRYTFTWIVTDSGNPDARKVELTVDY